jgi:hypothetical protein
MKQKRRSRWVFKEGLDSLQSTRLLARLVAAWGVCRTSVIDCSIWKFSRQSQTAAVHAECTNLMPDSAESTRHICLQLWTKRWGGWSSG